MIVKYKVSDFAKDLNLSAKKVLDELAAMGSTGKKNSSNLEENELNYLLEKFSKAGSVANLDEFLNSAKAPRRSPRLRRRPRRRPRKRLNRRLRRSPRLPRPTKSPSSPPQRPSSPRQTIITITASTATRSPSSIRSARKRPFPSASWHARPAQRLLLPPHRQFLSAVRTIRSPWIPALWI